MLLETKDLSWDAVDYLADKELIKLSNKWHLYRGLMDAPCNLVVLRGVNFLFLSATSIDDKEHKIILNSLDWGNKAHYPVDKIDLTVRQYFFDNFYHGTD